MALNRRFFRILRENPLRYLGILVLILFGSLMFVLATGLSQNLAALVTTFTGEHLQEDVAFSTDKAIPDIEKLESAADAIVEEYMSFDAALSDTLTLRLLSETQKLNIPAVIEGRALSRPGEILLHPAFAEANGYPVGSQIQAAGKAFTVVGFVFLPHYIYPVRNVYDVIYSPESFGIGLVSRAEFADIDNAASIYSARFRDRTQSLSAQLVRFRELLRAEGLSVSDWIDITNNRRTNLVWASITGMRTMSVPMPVAMFLLSCLVIGIMVWRMIRHEAVIIGTLYAQGYRRRELMTHYMTIPLVLALAGGVTGSVLALPFIGPSVMAMVSYYSVPVAGIQLSAGNVLAGVLMPALFLGLSSYLVVRSELKRSPAELMKGSEQRTGVNALERALRLERFSFNTRFKLREQLRSVSRLLFLLLGVTSASVLMLFGFTIMNSMNQVFRVDVADTYHFEYEYTFRDLQYGDAPEGAEAFSGGRFYPEGREDIEFWVTGIEPDAKALTLKDSKGNLLPNDQTNITKPLADRLRVKAGDSVNLINKEDGRAYSFHVDAVADSYVGQFIFLPIDEFNALLGLPENSYMGLFSTRRLDLPDEQLAGTKSLSEMPGFMDELLGPTMSVVAVMTLVACVVALIIVYLVTSLSIEENKNTISLFKVFGYRGREVESLILDGPTLAALPGFLIAIPLMAAAFDAVYGYLGAMINLVLPSIINPLHVFVCFGAIMLACQLSKRLSARRVTEIPMSEALKAGTE